MRNLHVVFTMNPSSEGLKDRAATSPALFNRCVLNWFGDWSTGALYQVGLEFTNKVDLDKSDVSLILCIGFLGYLDFVGSYTTHVHVCPGTHCHVHVQYTLRYVYIMFSCTMLTSALVLLMQYICPDYFPMVYPELAQPPTHRQAIINGFVYIHQTLHQANVTLSKRGAHTTAITPRHYLDFINHYVCTRK